MTFHRLVLALFLASSTPLFAIHDAIVNLIDGRIEDLPADYQPATFAPKTGALRIGKSEVVLSPFLRSLFPEDGAYDLQITASWYHDPAEGPYYIGFQIMPKGRDFSYKFRLDLNTLEILSAQIELRESKTVTRVFDIVIPESLPKQSSLIRKIPLAIKVPGRWLHLDGGRRKIWVESFPYPTEYLDQKIPALLER